MPPAKRPRHRPPAGTPLDVRPGAGTLLLTALDAALHAVPHVPLDEAPGAARARGLAAACRLNDLLTRHGLGWNDVVAQGGRLPKLCGRLGSAYPAEREAAYHHAARLILRHRATWSALVRLPADFPTPDDDPLPPDLMPPDMTPPEADWMATIQRLRAGRAWRSEIERLRLDALALDLAEGMAPDWREARWLRDVWWHAELRGPAVAARR